jgi:phosphatidylglycerophosphate synthase
VLDAALRARLAPALEAAARPLAARGVRAGSVTAAGFAVGVGACVAAALALWPVALALWLLNRVLDGLDGALARLHGATDLGGFLDIVADLAVYGGFVAGVAVAEPGARLACVVLLVGYYVNAGAWLAYSSLAERRRLAVGDDRSLRFVTGVAEGSETIVAYTLFCLLPGAAATIAWVFAAMVAVTALQRLVYAVRTL